MFRSFDAAFPPLTPAAGCEAVLGYIGGQTPHVWTLPEWQRFGHLRQAPIWVYWSGRDAVRDGKAAVQAMQRLGWSPGPVSPTRRFVDLDMEASVAFNWVEDFIGTVDEGGYGETTYGSASTVFGNPTDLGYHLALWDNRTDIPPGTVAHQFQNTPEVDYSVWEQGFLDRFGWGPRR